MARTARPINPFYTGIKIPYKYFCDRERETDEIIDLLNNGNNVVLKAKRRIGKSSLIYHIFDHPEVTARYNTLYLDLFGTTCLNDFHVLFQGKVLGAPFSRGARVRKDFENMAKNLSISLGEYNPVTGNYSLPRIGITPSQMPQIPPDELFSFLENTKKPNIVVFDEFQQIQYYPERMAAILRSYIQKMNNTRFVFSGSSSHMLTEMFNLNTQPFYKSASPFDIRELSLDKYHIFCKSVLEEYGRGISYEASRFLYILFSGETAPMQETMNAVFRNSRPGKEIDVDSIKGAVEILLDQRDNSYREILSRIERPNTRNVLYCIAAMGIAGNLTSSKNMHYFRLDSASSVQKSLIALQDEKSPLIKRLSKGIYVMDDRVFELWIAREGNYLDYKYAAAEERFFEQMELEYPKFSPTSPA